VPSVEQRERLFAKLEADLARPVEDAKGMSADDLLQVVKRHLDDLWRGADSELDLAAYALGLLEFCDGPRPEVTLVRRPSGVVLFKLKFEEEED
jgi:hypothetical protein